jgi:leader peptidase (prepilin peptidase)/N-methyltransferase
LELPRGLAYPAVFALGCAVGSFLNVCIYRLPRERSVIRPPSYCPQCGVRLEPIDLVPLLSFLGLGRKCRRCGGPIAWRYFSVEFITGLVFLAVWEASGAGARVLGRSLAPAPAGWEPALLGPAQVLSYWIFASVVIAVVFTDLDHMIIPDKLVVAALAAAVLSEGLLVAAGQPLLSVRIPGTGMALPRVVAGGLVGLLVFVAIRAFSQLLFRREGMGLGDVKLAGAIGAMLGPGFALLSFGLAIALGAALGMGLLALRLRRRMEYLPFGPFLAISALAVLLAPTALEGAAVSLYRHWAGLFGG